jgi:hypothetical protein
MVLDNDVADMNTLFVVLSVPYRKHEPMIAPVTVPCICCSETLEALEKHTCPAPVFIPLNETLTISSRENGELFAT